MRVAAAIAVLSLVAACSGTDEPTAKPPGQPSVSATAAGPTGSPGVHTRSEARRVVREAVQALVRSDTGSYDVVVQLAGATKPLLEESGEYTLQDEAQSIDRQITNNFDASLQDILTARVVSTRSAGSYVQLDTWKKPMAGCWLVMDQDAVRRQTGVDLGTQPIAPRPVAIALSARGEAISTQDSDVVQVAVHGRVVLQFLGMGSAQAGKVPLSQGTDILAQVLLDEGQLVGLTVSGAAVVLAIQQSGKHLDPGTDQFLASVTATASIKPGAEVRIEAPAENLRVTHEMAEMKQGCSASE